MDPNDPYNDRELEAKEDDEEEAPRHPNDLGEVLPPEQDLPRIPSVNEHHHHANTPSGPESLMQLNTGKRKLTGEEETSDSRKRQQLTNMVSGSSLTRPYSQMPQLPYQYPTLNQTTNRLPQLPDQYPTLNQTTNQLPQLPFQYQTTNGLPPLPDQYPTLHQTTNRLPPLPDQYPTLNQTTNGLPPLPDQYPTLHQTTNRLPQLPYDQYPTLNQRTIRLAQPPYQYPTLNQTTNRLPQLPDQYPTLNQRTIRLAQPPSQYFDQMTNQVAQLLYDQYPTPTQTTNRLAQPPYQYPTLNQTTNWQQDSSSQRGPNAAAPVQQRTQSQGRNATLSTQQARRRTQDSADQRRPWLNTKYNPSVSQNRMVNPSPYAEDPTMYNQQHNFNIPATNHQQNQIQYPQQSLSGQMPAIPQDGTIVGRNHSNQPPRMQQGLPPRRPDMNPQTRMNINPDPFYLRFCQQYFGEQAGIFDQQQHSGPPMNIQEPSPDTALLPEMNQQMQQWQFQMQPQGFNPGESSYQGEQMQPQVPPRQIQPHGVNLESHLTNEEEGVGENEIDINPQH